jgi:small-conductance mechanosensitive channel
VAALLVVGSAAVPGKAQEGRARAESGAPLEAGAIDARRAEVAALVAELHATPEAKPERLAQLERLERLLSQSLDEIGRSGEIAAQLDAARASLSRPPGDEAGHDPPFTLAELDARLEELEAASRLLEGFADAARGAVAALEVARSAVDDAKQARRETRETSPDSGLADEASLQVELAEAELALRRLQLEKARRALETNEARLKRLRDVVTWVRDRVEARPEELEARIAELDAETAALSRRREKADEKREAARRRWERLTSGESSEPAEGSAARAELAAQRAELGALKKQVALLGEQLDRLERARELVRRNFALFGLEKPERAELARWDDEGGRALLSLARELRLDRAEQAAFAQELSALEAAPATGRASEWRERQSEALRQTVAAYDANLASLEAALAGEERLLRALESELVRFDLAGRLRQVGSALASVWRFEVTSSEDRSITVGRIASGVMVFFAGILLARLLVNWFGPRLLGRLRVDEGAAHAYQSLGYYALLAVAFVTALRIVDIPLTAFAVVGGALAIGVGFGSQNIVNNFISGLILLAERPIKRGDLVELEGTYGNIERIGLRSTRVRTGDNVHVIVPNSAFLENRVVNWTHNDRQVRIRVAVGVAYGSPTREVERLILQAVEENEHVLEKPEPIVLFTEFGDNSLNFEARFWVVIRSLMGRLLIESNIRYRIDELFRESGVVIAFPQRDVHLDAATPIPVRLTRDSSDEEGVL